jgi:outer membrane autotransporter protein
MRLGGVGSALARRRACGFWAAGLLASAAVLPAPAFAVTTFDWAGYTWSTDRADTGPYNIGLYYGRDDALLLNILTQTTSPGPQSFYQYEGYKAQTGLPAASSFATADLYIPKSWETEGFKDVALWVNVTQGAEPGLSYPTLGFYKDSASAPAQLVYWDFDHIEPLPGVTINYDAWNSFRINYIAGTTVGGGKFEMVVNGQVVATMSGGDFMGNPGDGGHPDPYPPIDPSIATMKEIFLNQGTSALSGDPSDPLYSYDVWWSNVVAALSESYYQGASIAPTVIESGDMLLGTYVDRRGLDWDGSKAAWFHAVAGHADIADGSGGLSSNISGAQFGLDMLALGDPSTRAGITAGYSGASSGITLPGDIAGGSTTLKSPSVGAYVTHAGNAGYFDLLGQYRFLNFDVDAPTSTGKVDGGSIDVAAEAGAHLGSGGFVLTPFVQLNYQHITLNPTTLGGMATTFADSDALIGRVRLLAQMGNDALKVFASAGVSDDLLGAKAATLDGVTFTGTTGGPRAEFTGGFEGSVGAGLSFYGSGEYTQSFDGASSTYAGRAGFRKDF